MSLSQRLGGEFIGTLALLVAVVGSGIMGETLSQGNLAIALLANSIATGAGLFVLIETFGSISGAHFNPVVSLVEFLNKKISFADLIYYICSQIAGAILGVWLTHFIFGQSILQQSTHDRSDFRFLVSELVATAGLILVILFASKRKSNFTSFTIAAYITSAYWFTSSTSFANPAVTIARSLTNTFAGIQSNGVLYFILAQIFGATLALNIVKVIFLKDN